LRAVPYNMGSFGLSSKLNQVAAGAELKG
jgi:hypothetical protein